MESLSSLAMLFWTMLCIFGILVLALAIITVVMFGLIGFVEFCKGFIKGFKGNIK